MRLQQNYQNMTQSKILEFARVELYKERIKGVRPKHQYTDMRMSYHTLQNLMRGYYDNNPVTKIFEYLLDQGYIKLCPQTKDRSSNSSAL